MCGCAISRRRLLLGALGGAVGATAALSAGPGVAWTPEPADTDLIRPLCGFETGAARRFELQPGALAAHDAVNMIVDAVGRDDQIDVYAGDVPNAAAMIVECRPAIVYNRAFIASISGCEGGASLAVLAHEVGHHMNGDLTASAPRLSAEPLRLRDRELRADRFAGHALRRLGVSLDIALSGIECGVGRHAPATTTHPGSEERIDAVIAGWDAG